MCVVWIRNCLSDLRPQYGLSPVPVFFQVVWEQQELSCTASVPSTRGKPGSPSCWWEDASLLRALLSSPLSSVCLPQLWNPNSEEGAVPSLHPDQPRHHAALNWTLKHLKALIGHPAMVNSIYYWPFPFFVATVRITFCQKEERVLFSLHLEGRCA